MGQQKSAEAIVGLLPHTEGLNTKNRLEAELSMTIEVAEIPDEMQVLTAEKCEQYSREQATEATSVTARKDHFHEESIDLLSVVL